MAKKKVLFVATVDSHIELFHLPYLKMFKDRGWEVHVATDTNKKIPYCDKKIKLPIKRSPYKIISNWKAVRKLREVMKHEGYDIVHCHTPVGSVVARLAGKKFRKSGTRVMYTAHGFHFYTGAPLHFWLMFYPVEWYLAKYTDTLILINKEDYERAKRKFGKRCRDIQYVPGVGVDEKKFAKKMSEKEKLALRKKLGLGEDDKVLICVGRLDKNKNQGFLIKAMKELVAKDFHYRLLLVGSDELNGKYQKLAVGLSVDKSVHFLGFRDDIPELLQISDVVVSASKREGLPVNLIEAAMLGLPIVATDCRGNRDVCRECGGIVIRRDNPKVFAKNVVMMIRKDKTGFPDKFETEKIQELLNKVYFRKKRVLHVLASNSFSGAENVACTIIRNVSDEFDMAYCSPRGSIEKKLKEMGIEYFGIEKLNRSNLRKVIEAFNPDVIHAHDFRATFMVGRFCNRCHLVSQLHKNDPAMKKLSLKSVLFLLNSKRIETIVVVSNAILDEYLFGSFIKDKFIAVPNYVDKKEITSKAERFTVKERYDLFFFGRLSEEKNPIFFIELVRRLNNRAINCIMIGDGPMWDKCKRRIEEYGLNSNIDMVGFQPNPYPFIKASNIGVMPSLYEGYGMTAIEATILGKPVINSGVGGLNNIFLDTNLIANSFKDYIDLIKNGQYKLPDLSRFLDYNAWRSSLMTIYSGGNC